ncbi:MAG: dehydrogenase [Chloroflexi bacterium HGW-Chloroflexi-10]|nr:MAG: dehydrogenase [Chloroflexi bacterium HGW-Chloroflexi-10]
MAKIIRWGILGTGKIAHTFSTALKSLPQAEIVAVGSRTQASAEKFADVFDIRQRYSSYEALVNDADVDIIYVSTPHTLHHENSLLALNAGKHVLCEKPLGLNSRQVEEMITTAKEKKRFFMEAMRMYFYPAIQKAKSLVESGAIGTPRMLQADFGFSATFDPQSRLFNPQLGGGALLDIGIYPLAFAQLFFGKPMHLSGEAILGKTGVDEQITITAQYAGEETAVLCATLRANTESAAIISGSQGYLRIHREFWRPEKISIISGRNLTEELLEFPISGNGMEYEAQHVIDCLTSGKTQSDMMSWQVSRDLMAMMDTLRAQWGLRYPGEK